MLLSSDMSDSDSSEIFGDYEEVDNFEAYYKDENDFKTYANLIDSLVTHLQDETKRSENNRIVIAEKKKGYRRESYVYSKTLYLEKVKTIKKKKKICIDSNQENKEADYIVPKDHPKKPEERKFLSPYYLFDQNVDREHLKIYRSLAITISEATRFDQIKRNVVDNFSIPGRHSWEEFEELIHNWKKYSQQLPPRVPAVLHIF
jgi:hypothetical protein